MLRQKEVGINFTQLTVNKFWRSLRYLGEYTKSEFQKEGQPLPFLIHDYKTHMLSQEIQPPSMGIPPPAVILAVNLPENLKCDNKIMITD